MKKLSFDEMASHLPVIDNKTLPSIKGGTTYSWSDCQYLMDKGEWTGGFVDGLGWVSEPVIVTPTSYNQANGLPYLGGNYGYFGNLKFPVDDTYIGPTIGPADGLEHEPLPTTPEDDWEDVHEEEELPDLEPVDAY